MNKTQSFTIWNGVIFTILGMAALGVSSTRAHAGTRYFKDTYDILQQKACEAAAHGSMAAFHSSQADIKAMASGKTSTLDGFYNMAASYGHDDVGGASSVLKNEVRLNWDIKQFKKPLAQEALYTSEASIKYFLDRDKSLADPKFPGLLPGYESQVLQLVGQAEAAFAAGQYAKMRKVFYHAIWVAYPVTSKTPFKEP
jgi:hypothetical protein